MKNLIESVRAMYAPKTTQSEATMMKDDGKMVHNCAQHVEHATWGQGSCIKEEHADPDRYGNIAWYDIEFPHGVERGVPVAELKILQAESHGHETKAKKKKMAEDVVTISMTAEEFDQLDELSKKTLQSYTRKATTASNRASARADKEEDKAMSTDGEKYPAKQARHNAAANAAVATMVKRDTGLKMAGKRLAKEETEMEVTISMTAEEFDQLDELSKATLASYIPKAAKSSRLMGQIGTEFGNKADRSRNPGMKQSATELGQKYKQDARKREDMIGKAAQKLAKEETEVLEAVDETIIYADFVVDLDEAQKTGNYDAHFKAHMKKRGIKHPGELDTPEKKKEFFNAVDAGYKAKNESVFVEAYMSSELQSVMAAHKKAGNRISDEKSGTKDGKPHHSFVVTQPSGKRTRHIYHGTTKKLETMSPAARSKESSEQDLDDK